MGGIIIIISWAVVLYAILRLVLFRSPENTPNKRK